MWSRALAPVLRLSRRLEGSRPLARLEDVLEREQAQWFLWVPVLLGSGIGAYFLLAEEPPALLVAGLLVAALAARRLAAGLGTVVLADILVLAALGFAVAFARAHTVAAPVLAEPTGRIVVEGHVLLIETRPDRSSRITVLTTAVGDLDATSRPARVRVRVRTDATAVRATVGEGVRFAARLQPPSGPPSPGGYDFARSAWFQGLGAVGYATGPLERVDLAAVAPWWLGAWAAKERLRGVIADRVAVALPGERGAIATALLTGERGGIGEATNEAFRDSGLLHVLSISGLHMSIMAGTVFFVVRLGLALVPAVALTRPIKKWAAVAAGLAALGYLAISGAAHPAVRSWLMVSIMFLAILLDRPALALRNVAVAALLILLVDPESLLDIGFQMSFAAVVALISLYEAARRRLWGGPGGRDPPGPLAMLALFLAGIVLSTVIASLAVAPFAAYHFHKSQQFAVLANLVAIPIVNFLIMPAALVTLVAMPAGLESWPLALMGLGIDWMVWCAYSVARLPGAVARFPAIPLAAFLAMVVGGIWIVLWQTRWRWAGLVAVGAGLALAPFEPRPDVLIARGGDLVAVRGTDGRFVAFGSPRRAYDLGRWLERDGDARPAGDVLANPPAGLADPTCRRAPCAVGFGRVAPLVLALAATPAALHEACRRADLALLVTPLRLEAADGCTQVPLRADRRLLAADGALAVRLDGAGAGAVITMGARRDRRPWSSANAP
jgi:competence protein ComEC